MAYLFIQLITILFIVKQTVQHLNIDKSGQLYECQHQKINIEEQISADYFDHEKSIQDSQRYRNLKLQNVQGIRITTDISELDKIKDSFSLSFQQKSYINELMESSKTYLNKLIKLYPRTSPIIRRGNKANKYKCIDTIPNDYLIYQGVSDSDLHILVTYEFDQNAHHIANAGFCELGPSPIIGRIKFNVAKMVLAQEFYQQNLWTTLHELTHILGFSGNAIPYWIDPDTNEPFIKQGIESIQKILSKQTVRGVEGVFILKSKNVIEVSRQHFDCFGLEGLPLENQGGLDSFGSHWEKDLLQNEYMTASRQGKEEQVIFSSFTAALLLDTGFYQEINQEMIEQLEYGQNKGCKFIEDPCENSKNEFSIEEMCEFNSLGITQSYKNSFSECQSIINQSQSMCQLNSKYIQQSDILRNKLGQSSKCFKSTSVQYYMINQNENNVRCHQYQCNRDNTTITVHITDNQTVICYYANQIIDLLERDVHTYGQITCPSDFLKFCQSSIKCQNNCSSKGFCNKGICYCNDGTIDGDCSQLLNIKKSDCQPGFYKNPDMSCSEICPDGYYKEKTNRICLSCNKSCSRCFGESFNQCQECNQPYYLFGSSCMIASAAGVGNCDPSCNECSASLDPKACLSCNDGSFLNNTNQCVACLTNCKVCKNTTTCTQCIVNYKFDPFSQACVFNCDLSCNQCSAGNDPLACTSCFNGRYLDTDNSCKQCDTSCKTCSGNLPNNCLTCKDGFYLHTDNTCKVCDSSCITCTGGTNTDCASCDDGKYLSASKKCNNCSGSCITCKTTSTTCLTCSGNKAPDASGTCYSCHSSCLTCNTPLDSQGCASCNPGYFVNSDSECEICSAVCITCSGSSTICQSCITDYHLDPSSKCVPDCDPSCQTCSKPHDPKACLTCKNEEFLNASKECKPCLSPCLTCDTLETTCKSCIFGYFLKPGSNICFESCYKDCTDCLAPNDQNQCISCVDGFYINNNKCEPCISPCKTCINVGTKCLSCISKKDYDYSSNVCTPICDPSCKTCSMPHDATKCLTCVDGQFVSPSGTCLPCLTPCKTCITSQDKCLSCVPTFEIQPNNTCKQICHISCISCTKAYTGEYCKDCFPGTTLIPLNPDGSGLCRTCLNPCKTCEPGNERACSSCLSDNYQIDIATKKCVPICDPSCVTCYEPKNPAACLSCSYGKFLVNDQCRSCVPPCKTCAVSGYKCLDCVDKYSYDAANFQCLPICHPSCKSCYLPDDPKQCKTCSDNSFEKDGGCYKCLDPCGKCQEKETKCLECISKIYAYDKYKFTCINMCDKSCKMCTEQSDPNKCVSCVDGKYLTSLPEGACQPCQHPCLTCVGGASQCTSCTVNYVQNLTNPKVCDPICHENCVTCSAPLLEQYCIVCKDGLYKSNDKCIPCSPPCQKCLTTGTQCLSCITNYTYDNSKNVCNPVCDPSCKTCTAPLSPQKCWTCESGKFLNTKFECQACQSPCKTCEYDQIRCLSCISAEYTFISLMNKCQLQCDPSCLDCSKANSPNSCISCSTGKYLTATNMCQPCTLPCAQCENSPISCKTCTLGYMKDPSLPVCNMICHSSCKTCSLSFSEDGCSSCPDGMFLKLPNGATFGKCIQCDSPCKSCKDTSNYCLTCISNTDYLLHNGKCNPICDRSCNTCSEPLNPKACLTCIDGYFVNQSKQCQQCSYPCGTCQQASYYCESCISTEFTYDPLTKRCMSDCHESCATCFVPYNAKQCKTCFDGYFLVAKTCQPCASPCLTCEATSTQCTSCIDDYSLTVPNTPNFPKKCLPNCHSSCSTCNKPNDEKSCLTCYPGYFYDSFSSMCLKCQFPNCAICDKQQCTQCLPNYQINNSKKEEGCQPICDPTCLTCSSPINPNGCTSCIEGKFISFNSCQPCQFPCTKCTSNAQQCLECVTDYAWNDMKCSPICDPTCKTCSSPKNPKACLTCSEDRYKNNESSCVSCKPGEIVSPTGCIECPFNCQECDVQRKCKKCVSGFSLNQVGECKIQSQVGSCHKTCKTCISSKYDECTSCLENRKLTFTSYSNSSLGLCECPDNTTDTDKAACEDSPLEKNVKNTATGVFASSLAVSSLGAIAAANPILLFGLIEFSQTISYYRYVNQKSTVGFDSVMGSLYTTHLTKLFNFESLAEKEKQSRMLQQTTLQGNTQQLQANQHNTKLFLNGKYPTFLANALALLILTVVVWLISLLVGMMEYKNYGSLTDKMQKIFCISLPLVIFVFSSQEYSLLCFYQFQFFGFSSSLQTFSSLLSIFFIIYIVSILIYLTYKLEYQKVLIGQPNTVNSLVNEIPSNNQLQTQQPGQNYQQSNIYQTINIQRKIVPYESIQQREPGRLTPPQIQSLTNEQRKFYVLFRFIKQDKILQRNYIQIMVIRKIICAMITVYGYKNPVGQAVGLFILYLAFWTYIIFCNPFVEKRHRIMYAVIDTITLIMHILLLVLVSSDENDDGRRKSVSLMMIILIIITFVVYLAITFVLLIVSIYKYFSNKQQHISSFQQLDPSQSFIDQSSLPHNQSILNKSISNQQQIKSLPPPLQPNKKSHHLLNIYQTGQVSQIQQQPQLSQLQKQMGYDPYTLDSPQKGSSKKIYLEPISNRGGYENTQIQSGIQLYTNNQQSPLKKGHIQFQQNNNQQPPQLYNNIQSHINSQLRQPQQLYNGTTASKLYKDYY